MGAVGDNVRIDDLREPRRSSDEQALFDFALGLEIDLDPAGIVAEARGSTGLDDLGDPTLLDRLEAQVRAVDADAGLSGLGRMIVRRRLVGLLRARLRFEEHVRRWPEALDVELDPPVIVVGLPRSGTTHLVNLLAADPRFRSLPWWEAVEPTPFPGDGPGADGVDPRYLRCLADYEAADRTAPLTKLMHDRHPSVIEEECELIDLDLCAYTLEWHARVPTWRDHYLALDQHVHYRFLRRELQVLSHLRGPRRWVLKCPQHLEQLGPLLATFPGATVVLTLRDPVAVIQSAITMLAYGDRLRRRSIEPDELAAYWIDRIERLLRACVRDVDLIRASQLVTAPFDDIAADAMAVVARVHEAAGLGHDERAVAAVAAYVEANPRGKHGSVEYDLRRHFHLEPTDVRARFGFYFDRFPALREEVR